MSAVLLTDLIYLTALLAASYPFPESTRRPFTILGFTFLGYGILGSAPFAWPWSLDQSGTLTYAAGGLVLLGTVLIGSTDDRARNLLGRIIFVLLAILAFSVWLDALGLIEGGHFASTYRFAGVHRATGFDYNPIPAGEDAAMLIGLAIGLTAAKGKSWRVAAWIALPIATGATLLTMSRAPMLALVCELILFGLLSARDRYRPGLVACFVALVVSIAVVSAVPQTGERVAYGISGDPSAMVRVHAWLATPEILLQNPLGGVQADPFVLSKLDGYGALNFFGQMGLVGGIPLLLICCLFVWRAAKHLTRIFRAGVRSDSLGVALAALGWFLAELFSEPFPDLLHTPFLWALLGLSVSHRCAVPAEAPMP